MNDLHFDRFQFESRGGFPASAEASLAFTDFSRMHTETHNANPAAWVPPFALNNKELQKVLLLRAWRHVYNGTPMPQYVDREELNRAATARSLRGNTIRADAPAIQHKMAKKHAAAVCKAGGFLQLHASIAFRAWRLGMTSVQIAESLRMTPQAVRQALWRMRDTAKSLGFDTGHAGYTAGRKRNCAEPLRNQKAN